MNGIEQKTHTKVTDALAERLANVETILTALDDRVSQVAVAAKREIGDERADRLKRAEKQRSYVDQGDKTNDRVLDAWKHRGLRGRLRWLVRGT